MVIKFQVTCANQDETKNDNYKLTDLGVIAPDGTRWQYKVKDVISAIDNGQNEFHTNVDGHKAKLEVVNGPYGKHLRTDADTVLKNNLLELPKIF